MKPPLFDYRAPRTVDEALELAADAPDETSFLAGGQSLVPLLNMRLARPGVVVDLNRVEGLGRIERTDGTLRIGAMVRQRRIETEAEVRELVPLVAEAAGYIAHVPIRTRGTVGGSIAHADPAAELPATVVALGGRLALRRAGGLERLLPAEEFFVGPLTTAIEPGEILVAVELPVASKRTGSAFLEVARTHGAFALVGAGALVTLGGDGRIKAARLAFCGVGGSPYVAAWIEEDVVGELPGERLFAQVSARVRERVHPFDDGQATADYRRTVAGVLAARTLAQAARRAGADEL